MTRDRAAPEAIAVFQHFYRLLESGASGMIAEADIEPIETPPALADLAVDDAAIGAALAQTVVIKLNGGLATSMGLDRAKSLLAVKDGLSFLDVIARQILTARAKHGVTLPLVLMNSFRTRDDSLAALDAYPTLAVDGLALDVVQHREPKLLAGDLAPVDWPADPELAWCPPGHADLYPTLRATGLLHRLLERGLRWAFCSNADNLGATVDGRIAAWMAAERIPFVMESAARTAADRKGGHLARRRADGRLLLRETAQTADADLAALQDVDRHRYFNTNNVWIDLLALADVLDRTDGVLDLPLIRNVKTVDPQDPSSPTVVQIESAMGAAIQVFDGARAVLVERDRFVPVKTTNDLLVLRSDQYALDAAGHLVSTPGRAGLPDTVVDLDGHYKLLRDFEQRFAQGPPSLVDCRRLTVRGDVTFGAGVVARGDDVVVDASIVGPTVADGAVLTG
ncbi:MAG: UTP--glucose-1-phosphate uridylyltransferase [Ilumatobacteraceae bacterium]